MVYVTFVTIDFISIGRYHFVLLLLSYNSKHGLVASGQNRVYMAGGEYPDGSASKAVWRYDPTLDIWQEVESMQTPRSELGNTSSDTSYTRC